MFLFYYLLFSSPDQKGPVRYCHHFNLLLKKNCLKGFEIIEMLPTCVITLAAVDYNDGSQWS